MAAYTCKARPGQQSRIQFVVVAGWVLMMPLAVIATILVWLNPFLWPYWLYINLSKAPVQGGGKWRSQFFRSIALWDHFRDYFPVNLVIEEKLDPSRNYLFGAHPHGILPLGLWANFATESNGISKALPGLTPHLCTLASNFTTPILREIFLLLGMIPVSEESIRYVLSHGKGNFVIDVPGGSNESLDQKPGTARLTINKREGLFRIALEEGVQLVPVFSFGESNLWKQKDNRRGTWLRTFQEYGKRIAGMSPTLFYGRPLTKYSDWGLIPFRATVTTVVGPPLPLRTSQKATEMEIDKLREEYTQALQKLYDTHKDEYAPDRKEEMRIIE